MVVMVAVVVEAAVAAVVVVVVKGKAIPLQAQRLPGGWRSQISRQSAHEGGKVVSPTHRPLLTPRKYSRYSFLSETESTPGPQCGHKDCQWKIPMTPSGIEPATFWLVAECLNQLRYRVPPVVVVVYKTAILSSRITPQTRKCKISKYHLPWAWRTEDSF